MEEREEDGEEEMETREERGGEGRHGWEVRQVPP